MAQHKWHKEIKAWAEGQDIQWKAEVTTGEWVDVGDRVPMWHRLDVDFRIKPQPKEPQYLYVYADEGGINFSQWHTEFTNGIPYIGKIKLEVDD